MTLPTNYYSSVQVNMLGCNLTMMTSTSSRTWVRINCLWSWTLLTMWGWMRTWWWRGCYLTKKTSSSSHTWNYVTLCSIFTLPTNYHSSVQVNTAGCNLTMMTCVRTNCLWSRTLLTVWGWMRPWWWCGSCRWTVLWSWRPNTQCWKPEPGLRTSSPKPRKLFDLQ